jgi:hypothetical protein
MQPRADADGRASPRNDAPMIDPLGEQAAVVSRLNWQLIVFPLYVQSVQRRILASRAHSGCASTLPQLPSCMAEAWPHSGVGELATKDACEGP